MKKEISILVIILLVSAFLRFYNLMHDSPYFFNPDERNMANAISQFRLPSDLSQIPICLISQKSTINNQPPTNNCNLNPHFFSYGQFPLYLAYASDQIFKIPISLISQISPIQPPTTNHQLTTSFSSAIFWLRFYSAMSSILTVLFVYLITKQLLTSHSNNLTSHLPLLTSLMTAFTPGLIQSAHFGTTESLLTFFFIASVYLSIRYLSNLGNLKFVLLTSLTIGLSLGSKLTGIFFFIPPLITLMIQVIRLFKKKRKKFLIGVLEYWSIGVLVLIGSISIFIISSPYNLVEPENFKSAVFGYEHDVATGRYEAFYTRQFVNTTPIIFQAEKIFPYALGWPVFVFGTLGFLLISIQPIIKSLLSMRKKLQIINYKLQINDKINNFKIYNSFIILNLSFIIYFIPNSFLFSKWTRFMTPVLPFFSIFATFALFWLYSVLQVHRFKFTIYNLQFSLNFQTLKIKNLDFISNFKFQISNYLIGVLVFISFLPGIAFMSIYTHEDTRLTASKWIYQNIPNNSYILSETANVVDIPLGIPTTNNQPPTNNYTVISFDFYHLDESKTLFNDLLDHLEKANYIFIPSRRIFANNTKLPEKYPLVTKYYQLLFSGALGFEKVTEISSFPQLSIINYQLSDEQSEETYTVFDHPVVRIYRKVKPITIEQYKLFFTNN